LIRPVFVQADGVTSAHLESREQRAGALGHRAPRLLAQRGDERSPLVALELLRDRRQYGKALRRQI